MKTIISYFDAHSDREKPMATIEPQGHPIIPRVGEIVMLDMLEDSQSVELNSGETRQAYDMGVVADIAYFYRSKKDEDYLHISIGLRDPDEIEWADGLYPTYIENEDYRNPKAPSLRLFSSWVEKWDREEVTE
jgi:hypothetical protein